jgi:hypothetical protein
MYLDASTRQQWASNNMSAINSKRLQAQKDLQPVYDNIAKNDTQAWTLVETDGEKYYLSWSTDATVWAYVKDEPSTTRDDLKTSIVSIGSYSVNSQLLGISGYIWSNLPVGYQKLQYSEAVVLNYVIP